MSTPDQPTNEQNSAIDPTQLGADQGPGAAPEDNPRDMSSVMADADNRQQGAGEQQQEMAADGNSTQGSDFDQQRRQGAEGAADNSGAVGRGEGMGRAGFNGDEDRGYDQSGHRGGLGTSGGRDDTADRQLDADRNPYAGGYGGGNYDQPDDDLKQRIGMNTPDSNENSPAPTDESGTG